ncbi:MAG: IS3 family transposase [Erysipelotrichaceae bacterium]|nr:IS3 family transposase [Erysipelotrichaceae bacterium]
MIKEIFEDSKCTYGSRRIAEGLQVKYGVIFNRKKVQRIMNKYYLKPRYYKEPKNNAIKKRLEENVKPNLLNRDFIADKPNQKWCTVVTYLTYKGKRAYMSSIIDCMT